MASAPPGSPRGGLFRSKLSGAVCAILLLFPFAFPFVVSASAAELKVEAVNAAEFSDKPLPQHAITPLAIRTQVLLDRAHFSPGEIDGKLGENTKKALRAYAEAQQLPGGGNLTQEIWQKLSADDRPPLAQYTISAKDVAGPFLPKLPSKMEAMKLLPHLSYTSPREALAEKFHMSESLLAALNPGQRFDREGATINVTDVAVTNQDRVAIERLEVDKERQTVKAFDKSGNLLAYFPATVGSEEKPSPSGTLKVTGIHFNPTYRYNPAYKFKGVRSRSAFTIKPGPNNPVGTVWINLSAEGYGIHGTPNPGKISKAESHGCVRLTNWDAEWLAQTINKGMPVAFVEDTKS